MSPLNTFCASPKRNRVYASSYGNSSPACSCKPGQTGEAWNTELQYRNGTQQLLRGSVRQQEYAVHAIVVTEKGKWTTCSILHPYNTTCFSTDTRFIYLPYFLSSHGRTLINNEDHIFGYAWKASGGKVMDEKPTIFLQETQKRWEYNTATFLFSNCPYNLHVLLLTTDSITTN